MMTPKPATISAARAALDEGTLTSSDLVEAYLSRSETVGADLGVYLHVERPGALRDAAASAERRRKGHEPRLLEGIPIALKDILLTKGMPTTAGSKILEGFDSPYDATVVQRLKEAGAILIGKTNMDEFAMGSSTENSSYLTTRNPYDRQRAPGGSSGGSAAAVAADLCCAAIGTDTGGSIRQPASFCGVVGLKPTYGRVSRYGVIAFASSLDQVGPFTRTAADAATLMQAIAGHDPRDSTSSPRPSEDYSTKLDQGVAGLRIGVPEEYFVDGMDEAVESSVRDALATFESAGAELVPISLPHTRYAIATYYLIATAEASSNLARYDGIRYGRRDSEATDLSEVYFRSRIDGFGDEVRRRIMLGTFVLSAGYYDAYYLKAQKVRTLIRRDFETAFTNVDVIATPTSPTVAFPLGERTDDPLSMYLSDIYTISCNLAGLPGLSVPCGMAPGRLPIGLQLLGKPYAEADLLGWGSAFESLRGPFLGPEEQS